MSETEASAAAEAESTPAPPTPVVLASLWRRLLAGSVDALVLLALGGICLMAAVSAHGADRYATSLEVGLDGLVDWLVIHANVAIPSAIALIPLGFLYGFLSAWLLGGTLGQQLLGLRTVWRGSPAGRLPIVVAAIRALVSSLSTALLLIGRLFALIDLRRRTLADRAAGTYIIDLRHGGPA